MIKTQCKHGASWLLSLLDMLEFHAHLYLELTQAIARASGSLKRLHAGKQLDGVLSDSAKSQFLVLINSYRETLSSNKKKYLQLGLTVCAKQIERIDNGITNLLSKAEITGQDVMDFVDAFDELAHRLTDELSGRLVLIVSAEHSRYYEGAQPFGDRVLQNFKFVSYDIEEAGKCLALDRGTACVMHLMRVIEAAVAAVAAGVGMPLDVAKKLKAWEQLLKEINNKIRANNAAKIPAWMASQNFYEDALAYFYAVKDAWRNPTMHLERKYTPEEAERIYVAVKNLMLQLAEHLDESGVFTA